MFLFKKKNDKREEKNAIENISKAENGDKTSDSNLVKMDVDEILASINHYKEHHPVTKEERMNASTARADFHIPMIDHEKNSKTDTLDDKISDVDVMVYDSATREYYVKNHDEDKKTSTKVLKIGKRKHENFTGSFIWEPDNMVSNTESKTENRDFYSAVYAQLYNA